MQIHLETRVSDEKRNGRLSLSNALTILGMLAGLGAVWGTLSADNADTKRRVTTLEKRQAEDRAETKNDVREVKQDVKQIGSDVQIILRKLDAIEAGQRARERGQR